MIANPRLPRSLVLGTVLVLLLATLPGCVMLVGVPSGLFAGQELQETQVEGSGEAKILLLPIEGTISAEPESGRFGLTDEPSMLEKVSRQLDQAAKDPAVKAVVLRINSPGGGVTASDDIYARIRAFKEKQDIPVIAALGNVAASGGYYVALAADRIIAHPTTVTGSIGVIVVSLSADGLMEKIGVRNETVASGDNKDILSPLSRSTPEQRQIVGSIVEDLHSRFVELVRENRPELRTERLEEITDGRIFSAGQARELGLVDEVARLDDALAIAREMAGVAQARVIMYRRGGPPPETIYSLLGAASDQSPWAALSVLEPISQGPRFLYLWAPRF